MKVAIFTDTFYPDINGVSRTFKHFTEFLERRGINYKVFAPVSRSNEYVSNHILRFKSLPLFLYPECRMAFPNLQKIKTDLKEFNPDIIHVATPFNMGLCGIYLATKLHIPLVGSYHTDFDYYLKFYNLPFLSKSLWTYMKWFHKPFRKLFVPSHETMHQLTRHGLRNLETWYAGVDCELFHPNYDKKAVRKKYGITKKYLLSYVGRLSPEKDVKTLLAISKALPPEIKEQIQWIVVGDGPLKEKLQYDAPSNMIFTGYLTGEQLAEVYSASNLFVFPSPTETFGMVVLEALSSGIPAITANSGGVKNIVKSGITGFLCKPGETKDFVQRITQLLEHDDLLKQLSIEARSYALTHDWDRYFDQLLWHYRAIIENVESKKFA